MKNDDVRYAIVDAAGKFADEYRAILDDAQSSSKKVDDNTYELLYNLGSSVKHAFDNIEHALDK